MERLAVVMMTLACACTSAPPTHVSIVAPQTTATTPSATITAGDAGVFEDCAAFTKRTTLAVLHAEGSDEASGLERTLVGFCSPSWRVEMPNLNGVAPRESAFAIESNFTIVHTDAAGDRTYFSLPPDALFDYGVRIPQKPVLFDFDGDGDPEIFVDVREEGDEGHYARMNALLTFKDGRISRYPKVDALDIDTLEEHRRRRTPRHSNLCRIQRWSRNPCASGFEHDRPPSRFVAHSLADGNFFHDRRRRKTLCRELLRVASGVDPKFRRCDLREALRAKSGENHV